MGGNSITIIIDKKGDVIPMSTVKDRGMKKLSVRIPTVKPIYSRSHTLVVLFNQKKIVIVMTHEYPLDVTRCVRL